MFSKSNQLLKSWTNARSLISTMKKSKNIPTNDKAQNNEASSLESAIFVEKDGSIILKIHATPGSKRSAITSIDEHELHVALAARPVDGQANKELLEFMASELGLRKTELDFRKGAKSRSKMLVINSSRFSVDDIKRKIEEQINS